MGRNTLARCEKNYHLSSPKPRASTSKSTPPWVSWIWTIGKFKKAKESRLKSTTKTKMTFLEWLPAFKTSTSSVTSTSSLPNKTKNPNPCLNKRTSKSILSILSNKIKSQSSTISSSSKNKPMNTGSNSYAWNSKDANNNKPKENTNKH